MKITVQSSKTIKPIYDDDGNNAPSPQQPEAVLLTVFDKATFDQRISAMNFFHPPSPSTAALESGLARILTACRVWAGRLGVDPTTGNRAILLNDAGARLVEATADVSLSSMMPTEPTPELQSLHPSRHGVEELLLVQATRFTCGSFVVGYTLHHLVADGQAMATTMVALGQAIRGVPVDPVPVIDRALPVFAPRNPPRVEFEHRDAEFKLPHHQTEKVYSSKVISDDEVVVHRVRFSRQSISKLKSMASSSSTSRRPSYTTLQCVVAYLWRCITKARRFAGHQITTTMRVAVNGRTRLHDPPIPQEYIGNAVLWARPTATMAELADMPLGHVVELVSRAVARMDDRYFRSFIDLASSGAVEEEGLTPTADATKMVLSPDVEVYSLLGFQFHEIDFGTGAPFFHMRGYVAEEGLVFVVPSFSGDGSIYAYVNFFRRDMEMFKRCCYSVIAAADARL
ncbi:hypothetical protein QOZ80_9BG0716400 [Eleusine coracana subsp. coracana]|nr:hypothetical protein QOZ80_9BG0716400 [Eleusine coracana subsp. coracana]